VKQTHEDRCYPVDLIIVGVAAPDRFQFHVHYAPFGNCTGKVSGEIDIAL
jgi:hypothetical protein